MFTALMAIVQAVVALAAPNSEKAPGCAGLHRASDVTTATDGDAG